MIDLDRYRANEALWTDFAYQHETGERGSFDANEDRRLGAAYALQYDRSDADEAFIRFLLQEEITARANDSFQGVGDALPLLSFLLAGFKRAADVPLFVRAKYANFDTSCGYDSQFIWYALRTETMPYLQQHAKTEYDILIDMEAGGFATADNAELDEWWQDFSSYYVDNIDDEDAHTLYNQYEVLGEHALARTYFDRWVAELPESVASDKSVAGELSWQNRYVEAAVLYERVLEKTQHSLSDWDHLGALKSLLCTYLDGEQWAAALATVQRCEPIANGFTDWQCCGLGWDLLLQVFRCAKAMPIDVDAAAVFALGNEWLTRCEAGKGHAMAPIGYRAAAEAARRVGNERADYFQAQYDEALSPRS